MSTIDFETPLLTAVSFPKWTGGKFLINCLALSPDAVLQDRDLAQRQIEHGLTPMEKLYMILDRLHKVEDQWNDLDLGGPNFFGFGQDCWLHCDLDHVRYWPFDPIVARTVAAGKRFFFVGHGVLFMQRFQALWPNLSVIVLHNPDQFCDQYRPQYLARRRFEKQRLDQLWPMVPGTGPYNIPDNWAQWNELPLSVRDTIIHAHADVWQIWQRWQYEKNVDQNQLVAHSRFVPESKLRGWNLDWYLDQQKFLEQIESLYHWLGLGGFDKDIIACYHAQWLDKLLKMRWQAFATDQPSDRWRVQPYRPSI